MIRPSSVAGQQPQFARLYARINNIPEEGIVRNATLAPASKDVRDTIAINTVPQQTVNFTPTLGADGPATAAVDNAKEYQAWMYPKGKIVRLDSVNVNGRLYTDPKGGKHHSHQEGDPIDRTWDLSNLEPRRKHESNFMITVNTNREFRGLNDPRARGLYYAAMKHVTSEEIFLRCIKFGPKSEHYKNDKPHDVIMPGIRPSGSVEVGKKVRRMHCHLIYSIIHYSQIQIDPHLFTAEFMAGWNAECAKQADRTPDYKALGFFPIGLLKKPYVQIKLQPQSDSANIMRRYAEKSMMSFDY
jgi:hypothetical protein